MSTIVIYYEPWNRGNIIPTNFFSKIICRYLKAMHSKANPRNESYMRELALEHYHDAMFLNYSIENNCSKLKSASKIVLLYPDATGIGFNKIEKEVFSIVNNSSKVCVLNGRRRKFKLGKKERYMLLVRRILEKTMFFEFVFIIVFLIVTPFFLIFDWIRGRF